MKKYISLIPVIIGLILFFMSESASFGGDFYTYIYKAVYCGFGWTCISMGVMGFSICLVLEQKEAGSPSNVSSVNNSAVKDAPVAKTEVENTNSANVDTITNPVSEVKRETEEPKLSDEVIEEIEKVKLLLDQEIITKEEYDRMISFITK